MDGFNLSVYEGRVSALESENARLRKELEDTRNALKLPIAQLRHAYVFLRYNMVTDQAELARGLISPVIKRLENECEGK